MDIATSNWAKYIKERENTEVLETESGFALYRISGNECYLSDIWVKPELRKEKIASKLADQVAIIAKESGCTHLVGSVCPTANNSTLSLLVLIGYGMQLVSCKDNIIYFVKGLN